MEGRSRGGTVTSRPAKRCKRFRLVCEISVDRRIQILADRETESKELREQINDLEAASNDLHTKFEAALAHLEQEADIKDDELENLQQVNDKLGEQICQLEDEMDRVKDDYERARDEEAAEREKLEAVQTALKEVRSSALSSSHRI